MPPAAAPVSILVVDDDPDIRALLQDLLEEEGYGCLVARDGAEALTLLDASQPALVLLDLNMPVMSGWELHAHLRARASGIPVVFMSASETVSAEARQHEADGWLLKPFAIADVLHAVERLRRR